MPGLAISTEIISHRYDTRNTIQCCYMNVTLQLVLRVILRIVVHTAGFSHTGIDSEKKSGYSKGNKKCLFGNDPCNFAALCHRHRADVFAYDKFYELRYISGIFQCNGG